MLFKGETSYRTAKSDSVSDATILVPEDDSTINRNKTADGLSTRETATNTTAGKHEIDDITTFIERKFNYLSEIMEKSLYKYEDQIIRLQNLKLSRNVVNNKPVTLDSDLYANLLKIVSWNCKINYQKSN